MSHPSESNRRPAAYEAAALPTELGWLASIRNLIGNRLDSQAVRSLNYSILTDEKIELVEDFNIVGNLLVISLIIIYTV